VAFFQPPPTYAEVVIYDKAAKDAASLLRSAKFNPLWLNWFLNLVKNLNPAGSGSVTSVSIAAANNGIVASVGTPTTTPALTLGIGTLQPATGYNAVDGSAGVSGSFVAGVKTVTVKNGIITAIV
jgi:hypothetical protein